MVKRVRRVTTPLFGVGAPVLVAAVMGVAAASATVIVVRVPCDAGSACVTELPDSSADIVYDDLGPIRGTAGSPTPAGTQTEPAPRPQRAGEWTAAVLAALTELRAGRCDRPLAVDPALAKVAADQAAFLGAQDVPASDPHLDAQGLHAADRAKAVGFSGRVTELVIRDAATVGALSDALDRGRTTQVVKSCSLTRVGVGIDAGVVVIAMGDGESRSQ